MLLAPAPPPSLSFPSHSPLSLSLFAARHEWPQWQPQDLSKTFPTLGEEGIDLMKRMMEYDPARRISVSAGGREGGRGEGM